MAPMFPAEWFVVRDESGAPFLFDRGHGNWMPMDLLWGTLGWARIHWAIRALVAAVVAALCFLPREHQTQEPAGGAIRPTRRMAWGAGCLAVACWLLFVLFRVNPAINRTFGDASSLFNEIRAAAYVFPSEVLTMRLFNFVQDMTLTFSGGRNLDRLTHFIVICGSGAVFVWASAMAALLIGRSRMERAFLLAGPVLAGYLAQFFAYVETTFLVLAAMALFIAAAAWMLWGEGSRQRCNRLMFVYAALSIAMLAHGAGVVLLPATAVLVLLVRRGEHGFGRLRALKDPLITIGFLAIVIAPYYVWFIRPFMIDIGYLGNLHGGADCFNLVQWNYEAARAKSDYVYYSMISWGHFLDIGMGFLVAAPLAIPMILLAARHMKQLDAFDREILVVAFIAAVSAAAVPLLWEMDFGGWGDWNIVTAYLYPLNFAAWAMLIVARRRMKIGVGSLLAPALIVQVAMALGILLQLY
ncbi:MAG: hypothetical protein ABFD69_05180 [Candidatus Sumerlaeia bacterium]